MAMRNGHDDPKITSLEEARRRAAEKEKAARRAERASGGGAMTPRDWLIGGLFIAMALGMVWFGLASLIGGP